MIVRESKAEQELGKDRHRESQKKGGRETIRERKRKRDGSNEIEKEAEKE